MRFLIRWPYAGWHLRPGKGTIAEFVRLSATQVNYIMEQILLLLVIGFIAGILSGMFGIGGGAIIVPALMLFMGFSQVAANATSLAALLLPVGIFACLEYYRKGKLKLRIALLVAAGVAAGAWFGANIALDLPAQTLRQLYGALLLYMAWRYISPILWYREYRGGAAVVVAEETTLRNGNWKIYVGLLGIGFGAGILSGMFGIGGGVVIVPALMAFLNFDQKLATGTSLGALLLPTGLPAILAYWQRGELNLSPAIPLAAMLVVGSLLGARTALGMPAKTVRRLYGFFLLFVGVRFLLNL